jgi:hypothetical protein
MNLETINVVRKTLQTKDKLIDVAIEKA